MDSAQEVAAVLAGENAWIVGGAIRDELLARPVLDLDVACAEPERAARALRARTGEAVFPLSVGFGSWRVVLDGNRSVDFSPLQGGSIGADLGARDFTVNAMARPLAGGDIIDPYGGLADLGRRALRPVSEHAFDDDPVRLVRGVRLEAELGFRLDPDAERLVRAKSHLVTGAAGERIFDELRRLTAGGFERLADLDLLEPLGGRADPRLRAFDSPWFRLAVTFGQNLRRLPIPNDLRRFLDTMLRAQAPPDDSPRAIHRFRRATEPLALEALAFLGAEELAPAVERSRRDDPVEPLLRGDELGIPLGPEVGRLLGLIAEERAAGTISTREEAEELVRRSLE